MQVRSPLYPACSGVGRMLFLYVAAERAALTEGLSGWITLRLGGSLKVRGHESKNASHDT